MQQMRAVILSELCRGGEVRRPRRPRMLRQAGISLEALEDPENRLPAGAVVRLLERSAEESGCESFGLLMAERALVRQPRAGQPAARAPAQRARGRSARASTSSATSTTSSRSRSRTHDDTCLIKLDLRPEYWSAQTIDLLVGIAYQVLTGASGGRWKPACVHSMRKAPDDLTPWRRIFPVPIEFEANFNGFSGSQRVDAGSQPAGRRGNGAPCPPAAQPVAAAETVGADRATRCAGRSACCCRAGAPRSTRSRRSSA